MLPSLELNALDAADQAVRAARRLVRAEEISRRMPIDSVHWRFALDQRQLAAREFFEVIRLAAIIDPDEARDLFDATLARIAEIHRRHEEPAP